MKSKLLGLATTVVALSTTLVYGNMANPVQEGSWVRPPFVQEHVDVTREEILIRLDSAFSQAMFVVDYYFEVDTMGVATPFIFHALDYESDFTASLDGQSLALYPLQYYQPVGEMEDAEVWYFNDGWADSMVLRTPLRIDSSKLDTPAEFWFFQTDLRPGPHYVRVTYLAQNRWRDTWERIVSYSFRYDLAPIRQWRRLDTLMITLDARHFASPLGTNLGTPTRGKMDSVAQWTFAELPTDELLISYEPTPPPFASLLISIGRRPLTGLCWSLIILLHLWLIRRYRQRTEKRFSPVVIVGSLVGSLLLILTPSSVELFIRYALGPIASPMQGYWLIIVPFLFLVVCPVYWLLAWGLDRVWRAKFWGRPPSH